jgi:hypothetical protein
LNIRRCLIQIVAGLVVGLCFKTAQGLPLGVNVLEPEQVLSDRTQEAQDGTLYFQDQQGDLRRFVTSIHDPIIVNQGDGLFHPAAAPLVRAAIEAADGRFLNRVRFNVYILPYPVADPLGSWADGEAIYISPGVRELADRQVEFLISHEAGHLIHRTFLPDGDRDGWARYRRIRGIEDTTRFNARAIHRDRPREIFAEDFRVLFGSLPASDADAIENPDLLAPDQVPGLREFFLGLIGETESVPALVAMVYPNPLAAGDLMHLALPTGDAPRIAIHDVQGRLVRTLKMLRPMGDGTFAVEWDGLDDGGRALPRGAYYCLVRDGATTSRIAIRLGR